ncbi:hypothetical protein Ancab_012365 [Ancistrocladus abbreviatus]
MVASGWSVLMLACGSYRVLCVITGYWSFMEDSLAEKGELLAGSLIKNGGMQMKILAPTIQPPKGVLPGIGIEMATLLSGLCARANHNDSAGQICATSQGSKSMDGGHINYKDPQPKVADSPAPSIIPLTPSEVGLGPCEVGRILDNSGSLL